MNKEERGFTLIELLITLSIISLIAVLIHSSFGISIDAWQKEGEKADFYQVMRLSLEQMKSKIRNSFVSPIKNPNLFLRGESNKITLTALSKASIGGISKIEFWIDKDKTCLMMREEEFLGLEEKKIGGTLVAEDVEDLQIQYYDGKEKTWRSEWNSVEQGLPLAIKITLSLSEKDFGRIYLPPIIIPINVGRHFESKIYERAEG